ncbi:MAG: hypothetical protein ACLGIW_20530, partial [Gammaproteobacteria bacterium]
YDLEGGRITIDGKDISTVTQDSLRALIGVVLIALLAASIASQLARALAQAGLVERGTAPLWDSSAWLASDSALGALLHALVGYDARPSAMQIGFYVAVLASIYIGTRMVMRQLGVSPPHRRAGPA